jgi:hypothetical protein
LQCRITTPADRAGACVDCSPAHAAFPKWQEGRHPHCHFRGSDFTRVTARRIAQPPKATFVTRLPNLCGRANLINHLGNFIGAVHYRRANPVKPTATREGNQRATGCDQRFQ